jgi:hypothetical protein
MGVSRSFRMFTGRKMPDDDLKALPLRDIRVGEVKKSAGCQDRAAGALPTSSRPMSLIP